MSLLFKTLTTATLATAIAMIAGLPSAAESGRWIPAARDPASGVVAPLEALQTPAAGVTPTASVIRTGTVVVNITVTIHSALPATLRPMCFAKIGHQAATTAWAFYDQTDGVLATRSGNTATCTVRLPFTWADVTLANQIQLQAEVTSNLDRLATTAQPLARGSTIYLPNVAFPAEGGTRTVSVSTTL